MDEGAGIAGMGACFGVVAFLVLANALGYVLPIRFAAIAAFSIVVGSGLFAFFRRGSASFLHTDMPPRTLWWVVGVLTVLGGWATARFLTTDLWTWGQLPISATVMAGNFPIHEPINPWSLVGYHYGPQFLAAMFSLLSGSSLAVSYNIQPFIGVAGGLLLASSLYRRMMGNWRGAALAAVLALGGSGFHWLNVWRLLSDLTDVFLLGETIAHPFRALSTLFANTFGPSLLMVFGSRTYTLGFPFLFGCLVSLHVLLQEKDRRMRLKWSLTFLLFALALALTAETAFVLLYPSLLALLLVAWLQRGAAFPSPARIVELGLLALVPALVVAFLQGGVLTSALQGTQVGPTAFGWNDFRLVDYLPNGSRVGFWEWKFLIATGLPFLLSPLVLLSFWCKRKTMPFGIFLGTLLFLHLVLPFIVRYAPRENEMIRLFHMALALSSFSIGVLLSKTWLFSSSFWKRLGAWIIVCSMLLSSTAYVMTRLVIPTMRLETSPLFASLPAPSTEQASLYAWVRTHTTLSDYFYAKTYGFDPFAPRREGEVRPSEEETQQRDRIVFMMHTGRFNVGFLHWGNTSPRHRALQKRIEETCDAQAFQEHELRYLVVETAERSAWFRVQCRAVDWSVAYDGGTVQKPWPRVYALTAER